MPNIYIASLFFQRMLNNSPANRGFQATYTYKGWAFTHPDGLYIQRIHRQNGIGGFCAFLDEMLGVKFNMIRALLELMRRQ